MDTWPKSIKMTYFTQQHCDFSELTIQWHKRVNSWETFHRETFCLPNNTVSLCRGIGLSTHEQKACTPNCISFNCYWRLTSQINSVLYLKLSWVQLLGQGEERLRMFLGIKMEKMLNFTDWCSDDCPKLDKRKYSADWIKVRWILLLYFSYGLQTNKLSSHFQSPHLKVIDLEDGLWVWQVIFLQVWIQASSWRAEIRDPSRCGRRWC